MKPSAFQLIEIDDFSSFQNLADAFGSEASANSVVLRDQNGKSSVHKVKVSKGLQVTVWNVSLNAPLAASKIITLPNDSSSFTLVYVLTPTHFFIDGPITHKKIQSQSDACLFFETGNRDLTFSVLPGDAATALIINMHTTWLIEKFNNNSSTLFEKMQEFICRKDSALHCHPVVAEDYKTVSELFRHFVAGVHDIYYIKGSILLLLSHFFQEFFSNPHLETAEISTCQDEKLKIVEQIINEHITSDLPPVSSIAKTVALSESTLKRHFKLRFGLSLYEYYLQKKMDCAKIQLSKAESSVKEVAYMLGYENAGSFIRTFKKHFQVPPGVFQKKVGKRMLNS